MPDLTPFEGRQVIRTGVEMPGASGGLNAALAVDAMELHHGDTVVLAIEATVAKLRFDPIKDTEAVQRVHVLKVTNATRIDPGVVAEALAEQRRRSDEAKGVVQLNYTDDDAPDDDPDPDVQPPDSDPADPDAV